MSRSATHAIVKESGAARSEVVSDHLESWHPGHLAQVRLAGVTTAARQVILQKAGREVIGQILFLPTEHFLTIADTVKPGSGLSEQFLFDQTTTTLLVRVPEHGRSEVTPGMRLTESERLGLAAGIFQHLAVSRGADYFESARRAHKIAKRLSGPEGDIPASDVLDQLLTQSREAFIQCLASLHAKHPSQANQILTNLFDGLTPSGKLPLPESVKESWGFIAYEMTEDIERHISENGTKLQLKTALPDCSPRHRNEWNRFARARTADDTVSQQAARVKEIYRTGEFMEELGEAAPLALRPGLIYSRRHKKPMEIKAAGYVQFRIYFHADDGSTIELRWHTKTKDDNAEIPNFRVTRENGLGMWELLEPSADSPLLLPALQEQLAIIKDPSGKLWIPLNEDGDWDLPTGRVRDSSGGFIPFRKLKDLVIDATHIDYSPRGMDCITKGSKYSRT